MYRDIKPRSATPRISVMKVVKLVRHDCEAYLAFVTTDKENKMELLEISMIWDFPDVFPEKLPGLPPPKEVEFIIELVMGM